MTSTRIGFARPGPTNIRGLTERKGPIPVPRGCCKPYAPWMREHNRTLGAVLLAAGLGTLLGIPLLGYHVTLSEPEAGPTAAAGASVLFVVVGAWLFSRVDRLDRRLKRQAAGLATRIDGWLAAELANDPLPPGSKKMATPELVQAHNWLWAQIGPAFVQRFAPEVRSWINTLERHQIRFERPGPYLGPSDVWALVKRLRDLSELIGPLPRT